MSQPEEALTMEPDAALVGRSLAGDAAAFGDLYARHAPAVATYVRRALPGARALASARVFADACRNLILRT